MAGKKAKRVEIVPAVETPMKKLATPWPFWLILVVSFFGGTWSAYFLVWQNLKRMGKSEMAKKFGLWGVVIILLYQVSLVILARFGQSSSNFSQVLLIGFPLWLEFRLFRKWREENFENKPKFQFAAIWWGMLGLVATFGMWYVTVIIAVKLGL